MVEGNSEEKRREDSTYGKRCVGSVRTQHCRSITRTRGSYGISSRSGGRSFRGGFPGTARNTNGRSHWPSNGRAIWRSCRIRIWRYERQAPSFTAVSFGRLCLRPFSGRCFSVRRATRSDARDPDRKGRICFPQGGTEIEADTSRRCGESGEERRGR